MDVNKEQSEGDMQGPAEDSPEFMLMMAYARRRRPTDARLKPKKTSSPHPPEVHRKPKKKKSKFSLFMKCIKPQTSVSSDDRQPAVLEYEDVEKVDDMEKMANKLTEISNCIHFQPSEIEPDNGDVIQRIVDILREHGDKLNEEIEKDKALKEKLESSLSYGFYKNVMNTFFNRVTPEELPPQQEPEKAKVALICEATSLLFSVDHHPMNRVLGFGARYLHEEFPTWISRNVGNEEISNESNDEIH